MDAKSEEPEFDLLYCNDCDSKVDEPVRLFECGSCGNEFSEADTDSGDSNICPECGEFGAVASKLGCAECGQKATAYKEMEGQD